MKRVIHLLTASAGVMAALWIPVSGNDSPLHQAALAWDRGDYVTALNAYLQILDADAADANVETIALQTGELFRTIELTTDGGAPRFSPNGRHLTYETGPPPARNTRLLATDDPAKPLAELSGHGAAFSPDGAQLAYLKVEPSDALNELAAAVDSAPQGQRQGRTARVQPAARARCEDRGARARDGTRDGSPCA